MGDIFKTKKEQLKTLLTVDPRRVPVDKCKALLKTLGRAPLEPFGKEFSLAAKGVGVKVQIDRFFSDVLQLPEVSPEYYQLLSSDPIITKQRM